MKLKNIASILALSLTMGAASAANFSFTGNFVHDNDVQAFNFTVGEASLVELRSWSYAGGVNAAGNMIARGGFDPILALFNSSGTFIGEQDDAGCGNVAPDAVTGACWDTRFSSNLAAGNYTVTIQQYANFAVGPNLAAGFHFDGVANQNFRNGFDNGRRDSHWAFDILNVNRAVDNNVPEPASLALLGLGLAGFAVARRRKAA